VPDTRANSLGPPLSEEKSGQSRPPSQETPPLPAPTLSFAALSENDIAGERGIETVLCELTLWMVGNADRWVKGGKASPAMIGGVICDACKHRIDLLKLQPGTGGLESPAAGLVAMSSELGELLESR